MWIIVPPSSTIRRASAPYSSGVYGIAGHCSRLASVPEIEHVITTGSSRLIALPSYGDDSMALPRALDVLVLGHLERLADRRARLARVDDVVDHVVARRDVDVDDLAVRVDQLGLLGLGVLGFFDLFAHHDLDRALSAHHADLSARPGDDQIRLVR